MKTTTAKRIGLLAAMVFALGTTGAVAGTSRAALSKSEYQQLVGAEKRIKSLSAARDVRDFRRVGVICDRIRRVSPLVSAVRRGCLDLITLGGDYGRLENAATRCGLDPPTEAAIFACLVPTISRYQADAESFYRAEAHVDALAARRELASTCIAVLGGSERNLAAERRLARDLGTAVSALKHQNLAALQTLSSGIRQDLDSVRQASGSLSECPHA